jgi:hypothetical protein
MQIEPAHAQDANGSRTDDCIYRLSKDRKTLTLQVDPHWLANAAYPVTIDPTVSWQPGAGQGFDSYTNAAASSQNYGGQTSLIVGDSGGATGATTLVRFNLNSLNIPFYSAINSATLSFTATGGAATSVKVSRAVQAWDPKAVTAATLANNSSPALLTTQTFDPANPATLSVDVTSVVQTWLTGNRAGVYRNYGFVLQSASGSGTGIVLSSSSYTPNAACPKLTVTYTARTESSGTFNVYTGAPREWEAGGALNGYQTANLAHGNVLTTLPITGWEGLGLPVQFALIHNSQDNANPIGPARISSKWSHNYASRMDFTWSPGGTDPKGAYALT